MTFSGPAGPAAPGRWVSHASRWRHPAPPCTIQGMNEGSLAEKRKPEETGKKQGLVGRQEEEEAEGEPAADLGPSCRGGARRPRRARLSPRRDGAASCTARPRARPGQGAGRSEREVAPGSESVNTETGGGGDRPAGLRGGPRPPGCRSAGPAAPPSASASRPGRAEYLEG